MKLSDLIAGLDVRPVAPATVEGVFVRDVTEDSRAVRPGSLFVARRGLKVDGGSFVPAALAAGAVAVLTDAAFVTPPAARAVPVLLTEPGRLAATAARLAERICGEPTGRLTLIGVTGTKGKTTTAHLAQQVLGAAGVKCGLIGTVVVDDGFVSRPAALTTPPAWELSRTFARMVEAGCRAAVMEVSSHALDQDRVAGLRFQAGVFTNLSGDHLDYHGTMEAYAGVKARLFAMLPGDGAAVVNADDPAAERMAAGCAASVLRCSLRGGRTPDCCSAVIGSASLHGTRASFRGPWGEFDASLRLVGAHNVMNALEALAACWAVGADTDALKSGIESSLPPPGRFEAVTPADHPFAVLVDYAHTDDAIRRALAALRPLVGHGGALRIVFGCGGDRDRTKRPRMGAAAAELADHVYLTSDNPRTEDPGAILDEVMSGIAPGRRDRVSVDGDRRAAIESAIRDAMPGDIVLIAGKGHETEQVVPDGVGGTRRLPFDDRVVARDSLRASRRARETMPTGAGRDP